MEPSPAQHWEDQRWISTGTDNPAHRWTSREQTLRWWHLTSTWELTGTISWTGLITLQQPIRKVRADWICWGSSGPWVQGELLTTFYDSVVASAIFYGVACWSSSILAADRRRLDRFIKKASSILGCPLDPVEVVRERAGWWISCYRCCWRSPTPCRSLSQHWAAPSVICCVSIQGLHPSEATFEGQFHHYATRRLSQFKGSSKCALQMRPLFPTNSLNIYKHIY